MKKTAFVFTIKSSLMQRLADAVRHNHFMYITGEIDKAKVQSFFEKMKYRYSVDESYQAAYLNRKKGIATFRLFFLKSQEDGERVHFFLMRTKGEAPLEACKEIWRDSHKDRITLTGYELVRHTRQMMKVPSYSWRYTKECERKLRDDIINAIRTKNDDGLKYLISQISRTLGFALARDQAMKMLSLIRVEWKTYRNNSEKMPELPKKIRYVQRLPDLGRPVTQDLNKRAIRKIKLVSKKIIS